MREIGRSSPHSATDVTHTAAGTPGKATLTDRHEHGAADAGAADAHGALGAAQSSVGAPLPAGDRAQFEHSLGSDLSGVRVHTDGAAARAAGDLGARAFTTGQDIYFGAGQYRVDDLFGRRLLAHEVAHTAQQGHGGGAVQAKRDGGVAAARGLELSQPGDAAEVEADHAADAMVSGGRAAVATAPMVGRQVISRVKLDDSWGDDYQKPPGPRDETIDYDSYKANIGKNKNEPALVPASQWGMTDTWNQRAAPDDPDHTKTKERTGLARSTQLTQGEWDAILDSSGEPTTAARCRGWLGQVNTAFDTMMLDTAQSQALYLAHMVGETGGKLEETIDASTGPRDYDNDATGHFRGRGPVQVTFRKSYMRCIAYIETRAEQLEHKDIPEAEAKLADVGKRANEDDKGKPLPGPFPAENQGVNDLVVRIEKMKKELALCREAVVAIKTNPDAAKNEKYAFLFSAAFLQMSGKVRTSADMKDQASFDGKSAAAVAGSGESFDETQTKAAARGDGQTVNDMSSAKSRGSVKEKVYGAAMGILSGKRKLTAPAAP
jgi:hypothetical protein